VWVGNHKAVYASGVEISTHEVLKTRLCKQAACEDLADKMSGPYAALCRFHAEEARQQRQANRNGGPPTVRPNGSSFEFNAASLVELGRRLDEAQAAFEPARTALEEATTRWAEAVARLASDGHRPASQG
jgi:hypothetical protein